MSEVIAPIVVAPVVAAAAAPTDVNAGTISAGKEVPVVPVSAEAIDAIDAAEEAGDISKKDAQVLKKKLKIKVDGVDSEEEIDFSDDENLKKMLQKSKAFDSRAQELSILKAQMNEMAKAINDDPEGFLEKIGKNVDDMAEKRLIRKLEEMKKSPEQLATDKMVKELEDLRAANKKAQEEKDEAQNESFKQKHATQIESDIKAALAKADSVLPKNSELIMHRIGNAMHMAMMNGRPDITAAEVIPYVEAKFKDEMSSLFKTLPENEIEAIIGKDSLDRWRKARIAKNKPIVPVSTNRMSDTGKSAKSQEKPVEPSIKFKDFFNFSK